LQTGDTISINVQDTDTIHMVKSKIQETERVPPDQQHLTFAELQLEDQRTLAYYSIKDNSTLYFSIGNGYSIFIKTLTGI
jgi:ubiquitin